MSTRRALLNQTGEWGWRFGESRAHTPLRRCLATNTRAANDCVNESIR